MVDDVLLNKVAIVERGLTRVREEYNGREDELETNPTRQDSIVLNLQRACEASIDLAMHWGRRCRLGLPQDSGQAFTLLQEADFIDVELCERMQAMVGFRNVAVDNCQKLRMDIVRAILANRLGDFQNVTRAAIDADMRD